MELLDAIITVGRLSIMTLPFRLPIKCVSASAQGSLIYLGANVSLTAGIFQRQQIRKMTHHANAKSPCSLT